MQNEEQINDLEANEKISQNLAKLFDYPAVGELFSDTDSHRFDEFCNKLRMTRENLERIVRYGKTDEAARATRAVRAIEVTLEFLGNLQKMRQNQRV